MPYFLNKTIKEGKNMSEELNYNKKFKQFTDAVEDAKQSRSFDKLSCFLDGDGHIK